MAIFKSDLTKAEKKTYLRILAYVMKTGKTKAQIQKDYLEIQAKEAGFPASELEKLKPIANKDELIKELKSIANIRSRRFILREIVMLSVTDHEITDAEMAAIYEVGTKSGIKEEKINDFFLWAAQGIEWQIEGAKLVEEDL